MLTTSFAMTCPYAKPFQSQGIIHTCVFGVDKVREDGEGAEHDLEKLARQNLHVCTSQSPPAAYGTDLRFNHILDTAKAFTTVILTQVRTYFST